ncbi:MAG: histidine kinase N-terminal domain-containing protein [Pseudomonadota bacterium]
MYKSGTTRLVDLIERDAEHLTKRWQEIVSSHDDTPSYHKCDQQCLHDRGFRLYSQLGKWLSKETTKEDIAKLYRELGAERKKDGFKFSEIVESFIVTRRVLWSKIESEGLLDTALDLNQAIALNDQAIVFFDRALFYTAQGYESVTD